MLPIGFMYLTLNMRCTFITLAIMAILVLNPDMAHAQSKRHFFGKPKDLQPDEQWYAYWLGAYGGPAFNSQFGTIRTSCNCDFTGGAGVGYNAGLMMEVEFYTGWSFGALLGVESTSITSRFREIEGVSQTSPNGRTYVVPIQFRNEADVLINAIAFSGYLKYVVADRFFTRLGLTPSYVLNSTVKHTKSLESKQVTFPDGSTASASLDGYPDGVAVLQDGTITEIQKFNAGVFTSAGFEIPLRTVVKKHGPVMVTTILSPIIQYTFPLTSFTMSNMTFSASGLQVMLEFRHNF